MTVNNISNNNLIRNKDNLFELKDENQIFKSNLKNSKSLQNIFLGNNNFNNFVYFSAAKKNKLKYNNDIINSDKNINNFRINKKISTFFFTNFFFFIIFFNCIRFFFFKFFLSLIIYIVFI